MAGSRLGRRNRQACLRTQHSALSTLREGSGAHPPAAKVAAGIDSARVIAVHCRAHNCAWACDHAAQEARLGHAADTQASTVLATTTPGLASPGRPGYGGTGEKAGELADAKLGRIPRIDGRIEESPPQFHLRDAPGIHAHLRMVVAEALGRDLVVDARLVAIGERARAEVQPIEVGRQRAVQHGLTLHFRHGGRFRRKLSRQVEAG